MGDILIKCHSEGEVNSIISIFMVLPVRLRVHYISYL